MFKKISIVGLFVWALQSVVTFADSPATQQIQLLDRLHKAGLISDALYARRRQLLAKNLSPIRPSEEVKPADPNSEAHGNEGRNIALLIGSNDYWHFESLETAINDVRAVGKILQEKFNFEIKVLENPGRQDIIGALTTLRESLSQEDSLLLYYAGHGYLDAVTGRGYWLPTDAGKDNPANWVSTAEINDALLSMVSQQVLVIADSCYSGSLADHSIRPAANSSGIVTNRTLPKLSRTVITSGGMEPVLDSIDGVHSVFSRALLEQLEYYQYGTTLTELYEQILKRVTGESEQTPGYHVLRNAGHQRGEFVFPVTDIYSVKHWVH